MSQLVLLFALQLVGSWACLAILPQRESWLAIAIGFMTGLAIAVFLSLPLLFLGWFTAASVWAVLAATLAGAVWLAAKRGRATAGTAIRLGAWAVAFTGACVPFCVWDLSVKTYDSQIFIDYAVAFQQDGRLSLETLSWLHSWGSFQIVAHALAVVTDETVLYALAPAFSISLFATLGATLHRGLGELGVPPRARVLAIAVVVAALLAVPVVRLQIVYVHANWAAAGYLFMFAALFWLADVSVDRGYLPAAFLGLLAFSFARIESPMFAAVFLVLALSQTRLARSAVLVPYLGFTMVLTAWLVLLASVVPEDSIYLTPTKSLLMAGAMASIFAIFVARDTALVQRLLPLVPPLTAALCVVVIAIAVALRFDVFRTSFVSWQHDLWLETFWGLFWWPAIAVLAVLSIRVSVPPYSRALRYGIALFFALVVLLTALGDAYGTKRFGSLTRVTLHIVPLLAFYFALVFAPALSRRASRC